MFTKTTIAVALFTVLTVNQAKALTVVNDLGGETAVYMAKAAKLAKSGEEIRIGGKCSSSCNIYLMKEYNLKVCALPGAVLRFHMPFSGKWADATQTRVIADIGEEQAHQSRLFWHRDWLGKFPKKLDNILKHATMNGKIPNPSETGNLSDLYEVRADTVIPKCR